MQNGKHWVSDYLSLFLLGIPVKKTTHFLAVFFQDCGGGVKNNIICFLILRLPDLPKNIRVFLEAISPTP